MTLDEATRARARDHGGVRPRRRARRTLAIALTTACSAGLLFGPVGAAGAATPAIAPANDNFANAVAFTSLPVTRTDTNVGATKEPGEPIHGTAPGDNGGASVWYSYTAPSSGNLTVVVASATLDTVVAAYTGSAVNALTAVAKNDDDPSCAPCTSSRITFLILSGVTYSIAVDGYQGAAQDTFLIHASLTSPANDAFNSAIGLSGTSASRTGDDNSPRRRTPVSPSTGPRPATPAEHRSGTRGPLPRARPSTSTPAAPPSTRFSPHTREAR